MRCDDGLERAPLVFKSARQRTFTEARYAEGVFLVDYGLQRSYHVKVIVGRMTSGTV